MALALVALVGALLAWSTLHGPSLSTTVPRERTTITGPEAVESTPRPSLPPDAVPPDDPSGVQRPDLPQWTGWIFLAIVGAGALILVGALARRWWVRRHRDEDEPAPPPPVRARTDLVVVTHRARAALADGVPRNGVVACWVALEEALDAAGSAPSPHESPTEVADRLLHDHPGVPADAVATLLAAYREARFSQHPISEDDRAHAAAALDRIEAGLRERAR
ncbi:MAG: DUF4129 domain-containing protein [Mobilicoccus sp.]|nr:DUF4129 domain-containing protein [Mobilicoccus sp.]